MAHSEFEITVPPSAHRTVELRVRVRAATWLEALAEAGRKLREEVGVTISDDGTERFDRAIRVRDLDSGRQYVVSSLTGELPGARQAPGARGGRPTLLNAGAARGAPRVQVQNPNLHRRGLRQGTGPSRRPDPAATRLDVAPVAPRPPADRVRTPPEWQRRRPVVRSDRIHRKPPPLQVTTPGWGDGAGALFKPVTDLDLLPGDVDSLIDAAVTMLADHIPCALVHAALWLDDRESLWVASTAGDLAREVRHSVLRFPAGFLPGGPEREEPLVHEGSEVALTYEDEEGAELAVSVRTLLCVPVRVERVPMGLFVLGDPVSAAGFTGPDISGATYLAKTIGAKVAGTLAQEGGEGRA